MSAYRNDHDALRARVEELEAELDRRQHELSARTADLADRDAKLERLRSLFDAGQTSAPPPLRKHRRVWLAATVVLGVAAGALTAVAAGARAAPPPVAVAAPEPPSAATRLPITFAVVLDARPSMAPHLERAAASVARLAASMADDDRIGVIRVDGRASTLLVPISPVGAVRATLPLTLAGLRVGETSRWERGTVSGGIYAGMELLRRTEGDARILIVTDGHDVGWDLAEGSAAHVAGKGLRVSALGAGDFVDGYPQSIARAGHGSFAALDDDAAIARLFVEQLGARR